jgi:hypothetical protein
MRGRLLGSALATLAMTGSLLSPAVGQASLGARLKVMPRSVRAGKVVTVLGSVGGGCAPGRGAATIYSLAFKGATGSEFAGVPAVYATVHGNGRFSVQIRIAKRVKPGRYQVGGRCGGGNFGSAQLRVRKRRS